MITNKCALSPKLIRQERSTESGMSQESSVVLKYEVNSKSRKLTHLLEIVILFADLLYSSSVMKSHHKTVLFTIVYRIHVFFPTQKLSGRRLICHIQLCYQLLTASSSPSRLYGKTCFV